MASIFGQSTTGCPVISLTDNHHMCGWLRIPNALPLMQVDIQKLYILIFGLDPEEINRNTNHPPNTPLGYHVSISSERDQRTLAKLPGMAVSSGPDQPVFHLWEREHSHRCHCGNHISFFLLRETLLDLYKFPQVEMKARRGQSWIHVLSSNTIWR